MATERVLSIPELLESVLLHLDMETLLVSASLVSKAWNDSIATSPALQQALYFQPVPAVGGRAPSDAVVNPLLISRFGTCFFDTGGFHGYWLAANAFYLMPCAGGTKPHARFSAVHKTHAPRSPIPERIKPPQLHKVDAACRKLTAKGASWRRMLVSQPPPPALGYLAMETGPEAPAGPRWVQTALVSPRDEFPSAGLRMGSLYDLVQFRAGHPLGVVTWFRVVWNQVRPKSLSTTAEECCRRLLQETDVVVEFYHNYLSAGLSPTNLQPTNLSLFEARFRSPEYRDIDPVNNSTRTTYEIDRDYTGFGIDMKRHLF